MMRGQSLTENKGRDPDDEGTDPDDEGTDPDGRSAATACPRLSVSEQRRVT